MRREFTLPGVCHTRFEFGRSYGIFVVVMLYGNDRIYDWDENKRVQNLRQHSLDFYDVEEFDWDASEPRRSDRSGEERYIAVSHYRGQLHTVVYTERGELRRIISFRRANKQEVRRHAETND